MPKTLRWEPPRDPFRLEHVAALGVTHRILQRGLRRGELTRLAHGVYVATKAVPQEPIARHLLVARAHQLVLPSAIASHQTAALAWGLAIDDDLAAASGPAHFTQPRAPQRRSRPGPHAHVHVRDLPAEHRVQHPGGLLVTSRDRTALDVAASLPLPTALITLDAAARMNLQDRVGRAWLRDEYVRPRTLEACVQPLRTAARSAAGERGCPALLRSLEHADPRRESPAESLAYGHMVLAGLPLPQLQVRFTDEQGDLFTDFLWAEAMLVCEVDGNVKYRTQEDLVAERRRDARLRALGLRLQHVEAGDVSRRPREFTSGLARMLGC